MRPVVSRNVVVTGGAQGLGLEIARACVADGMFVTLLDKVPAALASAREALGADVCDTAVCDITDAGQVTAVLTGLLETHPDGVDALVNNAGVFTSNAIEREEPGRAALAVSVNLVGTMTVTNAALDLGLLRADTGQLVFVNSSAGDPLGSGTGRSERTYAATKGGLTAYARAIEGACAGTRLRVTTVYPGGMDTNLYVNAGMAEDVSHGQSWMMPPERVAATVAFVLAMPVDTVISRVAIGPNL
jgi:NADP-dependent 3-hydroxy acid dehydrogenase YdfG